MVLLVTHALASLGGFQDDVMRLSVMFFVNAITVILSESIGESEEALAESEEKYRTIVESARDAIITVDGNGSIVSWNSAAEKIFGYRAAEMMGRHIDTIITEENLEKHDFNRIIDREISIMVTDVEGVRKDGTRVPVEISVFSWNYMDEKFITAVIRDVTERKMAENALIESERKFRAVFDGVEDIITIVEIRENGLPGKYIEVNRAAVEKLGYSRDEFLSMTPADMGVSREQSYDIIKNSSEVGE
jgi:PAS domain S-box-containing protein